MSTDSSVPRELDNFLGEIEEMIAKQRFEIELPNGRCIEMLPGSLLICLGIDLQTHRQRELAAGLLLVQKGVTSRVRLVVDHLAVRFLKDAARAKMQFSDVEPRLNAMRAWIVSTVEWQPNSNDGNPLREFVRIVGHGSETARREFSNLSTFLRGCLGYEKEEVEEDETPDRDTRRQGPGRPPVDPKVKKKMIETYREWTEVSTEKSRLEFARSKNFFGKTSPEKAINHLKKCGEYWREANGN